MKRQANSHKKTYYLNNITMSVLIAIGTLSPPAVFSLRAPAPYPESQWNIEWDLSSHRQEALGADNWPITWSNDDHQYTIWGDNRGGFQTTSDKISFGASRVPGGKRNYTGTDLFYGDPVHSRKRWEQKSYGIVSIEGTLYAHIGPGSGNKSCRETRLAISRNKGRSWSQTGVMWTASDRICLPTLLNFGKDYAGARDDFVYVYAMDARGDWTSPKGILLGRVPKNQIGTKSAYEWYDGLSRENPTWTSNILEAEHVFKNSAGTFLPAVSYNPGLKRYLLTVAHGLKPGDVDGAFGKWGLYEAPEPWGPWRTIAYYDNEFGLGNTETFFYNFANKWASADGKDVVLVFSGITSSSSAQFDSWNTVNGTFTFDGPDTTPLSPPKGLKVI